MMLEAIASRLEAIASRDVRSTCTGNNAWYLHITCSSAVIRCVHKRHLDNMPNIGKLKQQPINIQKSLAMAHIGGLT